MNYLLHKVVESITQKVAHKVTHDIYKIFQTFSFIIFARDSMLSALYAIARPSVCLSVCHTGGSVENG